MKLDWRVHRFGDGPGVSYVAQGAGFRYLVNGCASCSLTVYRTRKNRRGHSVRDDWRPVLRERRLVSLGDAMSRAQGFEDASHRDGMTENSNLLDDSAIRHNVWLVTGHGPKLSGLTCDMCGDHWPCRSAEDSARELASIVRDARANALTEAAAEYPAMTRDMVSRGSVRAWLLDRAEKLRHP